ncbi:MAG: YdcF family protein [Clostridiales bacterium]|jgi:uncharacterized SAM-binding protein YcdF (DUF218 family)|nr:YdcF family protein [Clostridiales bacterium]
MRKIIFLVGFGAFINFIALLLAANFHFGHLVLGFASICLMLYAFVYIKLLKKFRQMLLAVCVIPVAIAGFLALYGNSTHVDYSEDVVIVLGAGLNGDEVGGHLRLRLDAAITYLNKNENALVTVSGGLGVGRRITEAQAMSNYLQRNGISEDRIIQEGSSTSTFENLSFSNEILTEIFPEGYRAVIATNDFHIYRATRLAQSIGIDANGLGAPTPLHSYAANYSREVFATVYYWVFGGWA